MEATSNAPATAPEKASVFEDFIDIFASPAKVFARREKGDYGIQLLIVSLIAAGFVFANRGLMSQVMDAEFSRRAADMMAKNPRITEDMLATQRSISMKIGAVIGYIGTPIGVFIMALLAWLAAKITSAKITYTQAATIITLAWIPRLLSSLVTTVVVLLTDTSNVTSPFQLTFSPARFMSPDAANHRIMALLSNLDVFSLWFYILMGIGIAVMAKVPRSKGYIAAAIVFVIGALPTIWS